jgi:tetratricopeptide (TPR) repeat protein
MESVKFKQDPTEESLADSYNLLGIVHEKKGDYEAALKFYQMSLEIRVWRHGNGYVSVASTQNNMAVVLEAQGKLKEALELYQKSLDTKIRAVCPDHVSVAATEKNI